MNSPPLFFDAQLSKRDCINAGVSFFFSCTDDFRIHMQ